MKIILIALLLLFALVIVYYSASQLSRRYGGDIRVVWYFFSLSFVSTSGIAWWGIKIGALDERGAFQGNTGEVINKLLSFMLDINTDLYIIFAIVVLVIIPQLFSYILSGLFGCATAPMLMAGSLRFLVWGVTKSFVVVAGVLLSISVFGLWNHWAKWTLEGAGALVYTSVMLIAIAFAILLSYREAKSVVGQLQKSCPDGICRMLALMHRWFTRSNKLEGTSEEQK